MGIIELLEGVGEDNLMLQLVNTSFITAKDKKYTQDTEITFATSQTNVTELCNGTGKVGVVVWMKREDYNQALNKGEEV